MTGIRYESRRSADMPDVVLHGTTLSRRGEVWRGQVRGLEVRAWRAGVGHSNRTGWRCTVGTEHPVTGMGEGETLLKAWRAALRSLDRELDGLKDVVLGALL